MNQSFAQAVEAADFEAIKQCIGDVILQNQGHALAQALSVEESQSLYVSRLLPILHRWDQNQLAASGMDRVRSLLEQLTVPVAVSALARFAPGWYVIQGCRPSPGPVEVVVLTIEGGCHLHRIKDSCFRYQSSRHAEDRLGHNYSFVGVLQLPDASGIQQIWVNGVQVSCEIQNLSDSPYVDQIDDLLHIFQQAQVPFDRLPELVHHGPLEMAKMLREPLKRQTKWPHCIRQDNHFGVVTSPTAHTTVVIPLYRLWHQFMQGHLAAFSIDPDFLDGQVEVMYVVDDPAIEHQVLNWARISFWCKTDQVSISRNLNFVAVTPRPRSGRLTHSLNPRALVRGLASKRSQSRFTVMNSLFAEADSNPLPPPSLEIKLFPDFKI